jgi:hypothetical protein
METQGLRKKQEKVFSRLESLKKNLNVKTLSYRGRMEEDQRFCLTMVYFLPERVRKKIIDEVSCPLEKADPEQYYMPKESMHLTIQNIKAIMDEKKCRKENFRQSDIQGVAGLDGFFEGKGPLRFELDGLVKMPESVAIRCFPDKKTNEFILALRKRLVKIGVPDDKVYISPEIVIGNVTVCRFYKRPNRKFYAALEKIKDIRLGKLDVDRIHLVTTNFVCHPKHTKTVKIFSLGKKQD